MNQGCAKMLTIDNDCSEMGSYNRPALKLSAVVKQSMFSPVTRCPSFPQQTVTLRSGASPPGPEPVAHPVQPQPRRPNVSRLIRGWHAAVPKPRPPLPPQPGGRSQ